MQCLSAPTRREVDREHQREKWLDIGVPNVRNLIKIRWTRSLPLHLFYNSTVFPSISANKYVVFFANEAFADPESGAVNNRLPNRDRRLVPLVDTLRQKVIDGSLERLDPLACINAYAQQFQTAHQNVVLIESHPEGALNSTESTVTHGREVEPVSMRVSFAKNCVPDEYSWICSGSVRDSNSDPCENPCQDLIGKRCKLQFSLQIAILVIVLNFVKSVLLLALAYGVRESPLMTIGDAVASFLQKPDITTEGMCLLSKHEIIKPGRVGLSTEPRMARLKWEPYVKGASISRWAFTIGICTFALIVCASLLGLGIKQLHGPHTPSFIFSLGLGAISPSTLITGWDIPSAAVAGLIGNIMVANSPQPIFSFIYFTCNGLMTSVAMAAEWVSYSTDRKGLRVSSKGQGAQRSRYFLQLPYRYSLPLMVASGLLHWLISQSLFLVSVEHYGIELGTMSGSSSRVNEGRIHLERSDLVTCGYSPLAISLSIIAGGLLIFVALYVGSRRMPATGMPVAGSCSLAIAAACHMARRDATGDVKGDDDLGSSTAIEPVQWEVVSDNIERVGHCAFLAEPVSTPLQGGLYAGSS
ncbi:hypothetical protein P152DRAFT_463494 [Eremomyces bilateralis CBS 781.70]|uniref:DUF6536 domain-containing protein n=1 Tax=Eremomyces bilateralis CBS 781.70 TaxID=1392243 RepID=A0A6G1GHE1_9PEZI|nr:uncharacterized protein P152DRAFT_463494 [Eremomyces bilateralis CBS 781.70]KAF1817289.1 hypothetical protein P152DRAFT_463494 [Eremomyces bilateralis CBS 781.70]